MTRPKRPSPTEYAVEIACPPDTIDTAQDFLQGVWQERPGIALRDRMAVDTAFSELVSNIIQNNVERAIRCVVRVQIRPSEVLLSTSDSGVPFEGGLGETAVVGEFAESGRGLSLMRALTDEITYERQDDRNEWRLRRRLSPAVSD